MHRQSASRQRRQMTPLARKSSMCTAQVREVARCSWTQMVVTIHSASPSHCR